MQSVPLFFAVDENYLPYLAVALRSLKDNASRNRTYAVRVLHAGIDGRAADRICSLGDDWFTVEFVDVSDRLRVIAEKLQLRDYYTCTTYYRIFIAEMFPDLHKALYLDSDTVILSDIAELYDHDLGDNLVGAVTDETVSDVPEFCDYVKDALGIQPQKYFNAGILLMNLQKFREEGFYEKFNDLLHRYKFSVAQDQDYLNVLCGGRVTYLPSEWNKMPIPSRRAQPPKLIHYNLTRKPWHYADVLYREYFWEYALKTEFFDEIMEVRDGFTAEHAQRDAACERRLVALAAEEAQNPANYIRTYGAL